MNNDLDVTDLVDFGNPNDECIPLTKCICGETFDLWDAIVNIYREDAWQCPWCGIKYYFRNSVHIYMVQEEEKDE